MQEPVRRRNIRRGEISQQQAGTVSGTDGSQCMLSFKTCIRTNLFKRVVLGVIMLSAFLLLCLSGRLPMMIFTVLLTLGICFELLCLTRQANKPLPLSLWLVIPLLISLYALQVVSGFCGIYPALRMLPLLRYHRTILFGCYLLMFMLTTLSFTRDNLAPQLILFSIIHISASVLGLACTYACFNISRGPFYFFYPCVLVISNDIFAYAVGRVFGKTPLYALSPRKTIEGFWGASLLTFVAGTGLCYLKTYWGFMPDDTDGLLRMSARSDISFLRLPVAFVHNIAFAGFASFAAPFAGFLASAIKRTFKKKDFGNLIPGHGGVTDRMDCQLFMVFFTYFYSKLFLKSRGESISQLLGYIQENYDQDEILTIAKRLSGGS